MLSKSTLLAMLTISASCLAAVVQPADAVSGAALFERDSDIADNALANFPGCDDKQTETLRRAIPVAQRYQTEAWEYFRTRGLNPAPNTDLKSYTIWFGAYSPAHYTTVYNRFQRLSTYPLDQWTYQLDAHTRIATVNICKGFFLMRSDDDNGQSIIHEASHFHIYGIAGTNNGKVEKDYGTSGCLDLARNHPDQAVDNADNYGYFAQYPNGCGKCNIQ
ncbi:hypothetical protein EYR38_003296 [Pleurotus pulmonarius]|nr:hypothetical protein EYR38_003296 [Pleurotus pulmonarius]